MVSKINQDEFFLLVFDNSGKTSLLNLLKNKNQSGYALPTQHPTSQELIIGNILFTIFDLGGHIQGKNCFFQIIIIFLLN